MSVNVANDRLTFRADAGCRIIKQQGRVTLVVSKEHSCFTIWVDQFIVAYAGEKSSMEWFTNWVKKVESGEYDESEHGKRRANLARQQNAGMGERFSSTGIDSSGFKLAFGTQAEAVALWFWVA